MERAGGGSAILALVCVFVVATILTVSNAAGSKLGERGPQVPCLQSTWNRTTGECFITNECDITMYGSKLDGVAMCGHSAFFIGYCRDQCQGLTWNQHQVRNQRQMLPSSHRMLIVGTTVRRTSRRCFRSGGRFGPLILE
ncbi:uncharacterized protein ACA1_059530 [Acanthamoeba castellanii str. Neff]|uniref:Uncharacterized protein n=1 Tax=Acanthamoeba castellanii (strain ATCC 30010 / Neff) TaxID=1257118 RepID=L8GYP9_ACACF|nr:uncharacterized protein ACA1_059530 [Acanthamoeba castellanii str. Neff]ELR17246.1 hypothetical protein ACA1_059530 [Acanthamoeba castellanii str. Neff]